MGNRTRRPIWRQGRWSRAKAFLRGYVRRQIRWGRAVPALFVALAVLYVYVGASVNAIVIEPISVPKSYANAGLTPEVMSRLIADALASLEKQAHAITRKERFVLSTDPSYVPDIELPGIKITLRTLVETALHVFGDEPTYVRGAIVLPTASTGTKGTVEINVSVARGRSGKPRLTQVRGSGGDSSVLAQKSAEAILNQIDPYLLGAYRAGMKDWDGALSIAEEVISNPPEDKRELAKAYLLWGGVLGNQDKYSQALPFFEKASTIDPRFARAYYDWGVCLMKQGKYAEAIPMYKKAAALDPKYAPTYDNWGVSLRSMGKESEAVPFFKKAIELDPKLATVYNDLGVALADQGKYFEAIALYKKAVVLNPELTMAYNNWGNALADQGRNADAIAQYEKATIIDPESASAYYNWGNALLRQGKNAEAVPFYEMAATLAPDEGASYSNWGLALANQGKFEQAIPLYEKAASLDPTIAPAAYANWSRALDAVGKHAEADEKRHEALTLERSKG